MADEDKNVTTAVSLPQDLKSFATDLGDGKFSKGVQIALTEAQERRKSKKNKQ